MTFAVNQVVMHTTGAVSKISRDSSVNQAHCKACGSLMFKICFDDVKLK